MAEGGCDVHAGWATQREELGAWVRDKRLLLAGVDLLGDCWVEDVAVKGCHSLNEKKKARYSISKVCSEMAVVNLRGLDLVIVTNSDSIFFWSASEFDGQLLS